MRIDDDHGSVSGNHSLEVSYVAGARAVDATADASVRDFIRSSGRYLSATDVSTYAYRITRQQ